MAGYSSMFILSFVAVRQHGHTQTDGTQFVPASSSFCTAQAGPEVPEVEASGPPESMRGDTCATSRTLVPSSGRRRGASLGHDHGHQDGNGDP